jgi:BlaI family transcriptional regulator, penicillinase repressor
VGGDDVAKRSRKSAPPGEPSAEIPEAELEVLACLWNAEPLTAGEIREQLQAYRPMAHGSVLTLLNRLSGKNLVMREKSGNGKSFAYRPVQKPAPVYRRILGKLRQRIFGGSSVAMVASLLENRTTTPEELIELKALLEKIEAQNQLKGT